MAKRGPKPKTARQRMTHGYRTMPQEDIPLRMPDGMGPAGRAMWRKTCEELHKAGKLCTVDAADIEIAARAWEEYKTLVNKCKRQPLLVSGPNGAEYQNPLFRMKRDAHGDWRNARRDLGLTALSRQRLGAAMDAPDGPEDEMAAFMAGKPTLKVNHG